MKKTALVTGGSRGIGEAVVKKLIGEGYDVAFFYRDNEDAAEGVTEETGALALKCDVTDRDRVFDLAKRVCEHFGTPAFDVVVCNAGISQIGLFQDMTKEQWENIRGVNLDGVVNTLQAVIPLMVSEKRGSIVLVSSMWGRVGASCEAAYSATKAAVIGLGQSLAKELGPSGIRVNCVAPGVINTDMNGNLSDEEIDELKEETPLGRLGSAEETADLVMFLASEKASFITGQVIGIDGGFVV